MDSSNHEKNEEFLNEYLEKSKSKEDILDWLTKFDHFKYSDFAVYFFGLVSDALQIFRESEAVEPTRIQLQNLPQSNSSSKSNKRVSNLDVSDNQAFPPLGSQNEQKTKKEHFVKKRITPRRLSTKAVDGNAKFIKSNYSLKETSESTNFNDERKELKMLKKQPILHEKNPSNPDQAPRQEIKNISKELDKELLLTFFHDDKIDALKEMFIDFLHRSLFVRPATLNDLLMFNLQVLNHDPKSFLENEINLQEEIFIRNDFIIQLSIPALSSILSNQTVINYHPESNVRNKIEHLIHSKVTFFQSRPNKRCLQQFVPYDIDSDSIDNFANPTGFHNFRKQRDCLNSLLDSYYKNTWRMNLTTDDKAMFSFINKIHATMVSKSFFKFNNFSQLAKLLVDQMLKSCLDKSFLQISNDNKAELLESRLTKTSNIKNDFFNFYFREEEMFFKDFIFYGDSHIFNQHLLLSMKERLKEYQFEAIEILHSREAEEHSLHLMILIQSIILLTKFIGFIDFYPYHVGKQIRDDTNTYIKNQLLLRQDSKLNFDVLTCILNCFNDSNLLLLFIPSIVEYLMFADYVIFQKEDIQECIFLLSAIYKFCLSKLISNQSRFTHFRQFIQLFLENFFDHKNINPDKIIENSSLLNKYCHLFLSLTVKSDQKIFDNIFHSALFTEYSETFSKLVQEIFEKKEKKSKNITMVSLPVKNVSTLSSRKAFEESEYQRLLFDRFFSHSKSLKKSCEFIVETTYRNCIAILGDRISQYQNRIIENSQNTVDVDKQIQGIQNELQEYFQTEFRKIYYDKSKNLQAFVMDHGFSKNAQETILRISNDKVQLMCENWFDKHCNTQNLLFEIRKHKQNNHCGALDNITAKQSEDIAQFLELIRQILPDLRNGNNGVYSNMDINYVIDKYRIVRGVDDPAIIDQIFIDYFLTMIVEKPQEVTSEIIERLMKIAFEDNIVFTRLIPPYILKMLEDKSSSNNKNDSWTKFESFLLSALRAKRLDFQTFQNDQMIPLLQITWNDETLKSLSNILNDFVKEALRLKIITVEDNILLDWMSWLMQDATL